MSGAEIITLGCRLNLAESAAMREAAGDGSDLVIINSCAVTNEAVRQTRQAIRRARQRRPDARLIVTGCAAQVDPGTFATMPEVDRVVGNSEKFDAAHFTDRVELEAATKVRVSDIMAAGETPPRLATGFSDRTRAFVAVQNGCDHRCTFCIIPYGRGNSRSAPAGAVIDRIKTLVDEGAKEVVLTGVDVTSYGPDLPGRPSLGLLIERILRHVPALPRLRLSSLDSVEIDARLFEIITGEPRFMPHLHMSFQAGDDMILKRMKRRHNRAHAIEMVARLKEKRPEIAIGADLIAGFPTETDAMHANSLRLIDECDIVMGHIFPYSPKAGTPAARMLQVEAAVVKARARSLREATARGRAHWLQTLIGTTQRVLIERGGRGHAENFAPVHPVDARLPGRPPESGYPASSQHQQIPPLRGGDLVQVLIRGVENDRLIGDVL